MKVNFHLENIVSKALEFHAMLKCRLIYHSVIEKEQKYYQFFCDIPIYIPIYKQNPKGERKTKQIQSLRVPGQRGDLSEKIALETEDKKMIFR